MCGGTRATSPLQSRRRTSLLRNNRRPDLTVRVPEMLDALEGQYYAPLAPLLRSLLAHAQHTLQALEHVYAFLQRLPTQETPAFHLDVYLIHHATAAVSGRLELPVNHVFPVYGQKFHDDWGHQTVPMPVNNRAGLIFHYIFLPREEEGAPHLETYSWLIHEVVHYVLAAHPQVLDGTARMLTDLRAQWLRSSVAVGGGGANATARLLEQIETLWRPSTSQFDWPHEIAIDLICTWVLGPVYISTLVQYYEVHSTDDAYKIERKHLPLELRAMALLRAGEHLGWGEHLGGLRTLHDHWSAKWPEPPQGTHYSHVRRMELVEAAQADAVQYCTVAGVPQLTPEHLAMVATQVDTPGVLSGLDVVIAAWWKAASAPNEAVFDDWVQRLLEGYADDVDNVI